MKKLDETNRDILNILQENCSITNVELAEQLKLSPTTVFDRVKKLEQTGIIKKRVAIVDADKVGKGTTAIVSVSLTAHNAKNVKKFWKSIEKLNEVLECYHIAGAEDFMLKVVVEDMKSYEDFLLHRLTAIENIGKIRTSFVLSTVKYQTKIPLTNSSEI